LTAGLYAARARLKTVLLERGALGGQVLTCDWVDNYPGFAEGVSGFDLSEPADSAWKQRYARSPPLTSGATSKPSIWTTGSG